MTRPFSPLPSTEKIGSGAAEMVIHAERSSAVALPSDAWGPEHMEIVKEAYASGATDAEFKVLWAGAKARGLDPVRRQIYFVSRFDQQKNRDVWASQVSIDGFRSIAENTGKYDGQDEPEFEYDGENLVTVARVRVYRKDIGRPFVGVARWSEYVQTKANGDDTFMWNKMSHTMLAKCAEALALRKAFPEQLAGLYTGDEMAQADNDSPETHRALPGPSIRAAPAVAPIPDGPSPKARALAFVARIRDAASVADLLAIVADVEKDPHDLVRSDMLTLAEKRRAEIAGGVSGAAAGGGA